MECSSKANNTHLINILIKHGIGQHVAEILWIKSNKFTKISMLVENRPSKAIYLIQKSHLTPNNSVDINSQHMELNMGVTTDCIYRTIQMYI